MVRGVGLDRIIERPREEVNDWSLTRRDFLKIIGITALTLAGVGFAGCSSRGSESVEFKPQNPLQSGYRLIYPENSKPVPDDVIPHIEEIGKKYFEVWAPGDLNVIIKDKSSKKGYREIPAKAVTPNMIVVGLSSKNNYWWVIGDFEAFDNRKTGYWQVRLGFIYLPISPNIYFVNQNMGNYGLLAIEGVIDGKAFTNLTFVEQGGGKVASFAYKQDLKDRNKYNCYAFHSNQKEMLNNMMQTIFNAVAENREIDMRDSTRKMLKDYAIGDKWRLFPEDFAKYWIKIHFG